jgi:hypothetical protein
VSRIRSGAGNRQQVRIGAPDRSLTPNAGLATVSELCGRLGVIEALDRAVGPIKRRDRGYGAGLGAAHQTGWTGLVARLIQSLGQFDAASVLDDHQWPMARPYRRLTTAPIPQL